MSQWVGIFFFGFWIWRLFEPHPKEPAEADSSLGPLLTALSACISSSQTSFVFLLKHLKEHLSLGHLFRPFNIFVIFSTFVAASFAHCVQYSFWKESIQCYISISSLIPALTFLFSIGTWPYVVISWSGGACPPSLGLAIMAPSNFICSPILANGILWLFFALLPIATILAIMVQVISWTIMLTNLRTCICLSTLACNV